METDGPANTKTRERTEGAATAVQATRGDSFSGRRVEPGPNTNLISFGVKAEPPALPCRDDVVVERGDAHVVSLILGDAHNNSRRRLSSHRQNLHSNGDHLEYAVPGKSLAVEGGSRLHESEEQRSRRHGDPR